MPTFGDYETVGEPLGAINLQGHVSTVWKARKTGARDDRDFVVKIYAPHRRSKEGGQEEALDRDRGLEFLEGVKQLKKAQSQGALHLSPIHDLGISSEGAWYVSDYYPRGSLMALIGRRAKVDSAGLKQIVRCVVSGCLALKKSRGVSHGNLKASNVFLVGKPRPLPKTPLVLADPYPAAPLQLARLDVDDRRTVGELLHQVMEAQDLRALGEIILQLVERRAVRSGYDYNYPIGRSEGWDNLGKDGERWRQICNQLLDPQLSLVEINLESLAKKFPVRVGGNKLVVITSALLVICLVAGGGYEFMRWNGIHQRQLQIQKRQKYEQFMASGRTKLDTGDYAGAKVDADSALENESDDKDAIKLRNDALSGLDKLNAAQKQKDYDVAMQSGRAKLKAADYAGAMTQADLALASKPNDEAARQLKTDAKAQQDAALTVEQKQKNYDAAMQSGRARLNASDYAGAMAQADLALASKPNDEAARQLKTDAKARLDAAQAAGQSQKDYDGAMQSGQAAFDRGDYNSAVAQANAALAIRKSDPAATKLKSDAQTRQSEMAAQAERDKNYRAAIVAGQSAYDRKDYTEAIKQADAALLNKPGDAAATKLKNGAQERQSEMAAQAERDKNYQAAIEAGQSAYDRKDYTEAIKQADAALLNKPGDAAATKLKNGAQARQSEMAAQAERDKNYRAAIVAGQSAYDRNDYAEAIKQADAALLNKPGDAAATKLKNDAQARQSEMAAQAERDKNYRAAIEAGQSAYDRKDYAEAIKQADAALLIKLGDAAATKLKNGAQARQSEMAAQAERDKNYRAAIEAGQSAYDRKDYTEAIKQADAALLNKPGDAAATKLKNGAQTRQSEMAAQAERDKNYQVAMQSGQTAFARGDYASAMTQADLAMASKPNDEAARRLNTDAAAKKSQLDTLDMQLEELCIELGVGKPPWLNMQMPPTMRPITTDIDLTTIDQISKQIDGLERGYKEGGWLTLNNRDQYISKLKKNLKNR